MSIARPIARPIAALTLAAFMLPALAEPLQDGIAATLAEVSKRGVFKMTPSSQKPAALAKARAKVAAAYADHDLLDYRSVGDWQLRRNDLGVVLARDLQTVALLRRRGTSSCQLASVVMTEAFDGRRYAPVAVGKTYNRPFVCNVK